MKYTTEQKEKLRKTNKEHFRVKFCIKNRLKNNYPISVELIEGFFVIESRLNTM